MAGSTVWKGYIHFGEIDLPVKLHAAVREERVRFHLLHLRDGMRLRQQMLCRLDKQPVPAEEQVKGFEVEGGKYLILGPGELEKGAPESDRKIDVHAFVRAGQIDPFLLDRAYSLEPDRPGSAYDALVRALNETGLAGIGTWTMRKRSYIGALQATGKVLRLTTLRYADELVGAGALDLQDAPLADKELMIGTALIEQMTAPFEPEKFENVHQNKLREMIERKARGERIEVVLPPQREPTGSDKLIEALEASLKKAA